MNSITSCRRSESGQQIVTTLTFFFFFGFCFEKKNNNIIIINTIGVCEWYSCQNKPEERSGLTRLQTRPGPAEMPDISDEQVYSRGAPRLRRYRKGCLVRDEGEATQNERHVDTLICLESGRMKKMEIQRNFHYFILFVWC